jgi:hypothetical protein
MKVSGHPYPWYPATDMVFLYMDRLFSQCARHRPIARALHPGRDSCRRGASSSPGGFPSRPRVAAPSRAVCSASVASPSDFGIAPHTAGALQMRTPNPGLGRPWRRHGLLPRKLSLKGTGGVPLQGGVARSASVGRLSAGQLASHLTSAMSSWGASAASPSDLGIAPHTAGALFKSNARPQFLPRAPLAT